MALEFASKELRSDEELARLAFKTTPDAYDVIDDSLKNVPEFIENNAELMKKIKELKDANVEDGGSGAFYIFLKKKL